MQVRVDMPSRTDHLKEHQWKKGQSGFRRTQTHTSKRPDVEQLAKLIEQSRTIDDVIAESMASTRGSEINGPA